MRFRESVSLVFMRTRHIVASVFALAAPALLLLPVVAEADGTSKGGGAAASSAPAGSGKQRVDPNNKTGLSPFMAKCMEGNNKYVSRDFPGAIQTYRDAIQMAPKNALGFYLLGEGQLAANNLPEAEASWNQAALVSAEGKDAALRARILFVIADLKEREKKLDDAKTAWQAYTDYVTKYAGDAGVGFPSSGASRLQAIDTMTKLNAESDKVKQKIKETADGGVFSNVAPGSSK
jgi:tetratricopeptide (TPR) repeat protein